MNLKPNLILAFVCLLISANNSHAQNSQALIAKSKRLKQLYNMAVNSSNGDFAKQQFFNEFPNTFKELNDLYGYETNKPAPLYEDGIGHIHELFNNLTNINDTLYYKKIIAIATDAHYDADAINYFHDGLQKRILDKPALALYLLRDKTEKDIINVWAFYFDYENSSIRKDNYNALIKLMPPDNKKMIALITTGYQKSTKYWKDNH
jgi:hypothetical protein